MTKKEKIDWVMFGVICIQFIAMIGLFVLYNIEITNRQNYIQAKEYRIQEQFELIMNQQKTIENLKRENQTLHDSIWHINNNILKLKNK